MRYRTKSGEIVEMVIPLTPSGDCRVRWSDGSQSYVHKNLLEPVLPDKIIDDAGDEWLPSRQDSDLYFLARVGNARYEETSSDTPRDIDYIRGRYGIKSVSYADEEEKEVQEINKGDIVRFPDRKYKVTRKTKFPGETELEIVPVDGGGTITVQADDVEFVQSFLEDGSVWRHKSLGYPVIVRVDTDGVHRYTDGKTEPVRTTSEFIRSHFIQQT